MPAGGLEFAVCSLPRSGSTALFRALSLDSEVRLLYEPDFGEAWRHPEHLKVFCQQIFVDFRGMKHVWDPNGWPFENKAHQSTMESLSRSDEWVHVNSALVNCVAKVIVLRRRNQLARILSDLLGQQTELWGHCPTRHHSDQEAVEYRNQLSLRRLRSVDERVIEWYLDNAFNWEDQITSRLSTSNTVMVYYEDLFDAEVDLALRVGRAIEIGSWLGARIHANDARIRAIFHPDSKLNTPASFARIPNIQEIRRRFGNV